MLTPKSLQKSIAAIVFFAVLAAFLCSVPAGLQPAPASAQGVGVTCGGVFYPSGQICGTTGGVGVTCNGFYDPTQTSCPSSVGVTCGGIFYPSGQICGTTGGTGVTCTSVSYPNLGSCPGSVTYQSCPDGSTAPTNQGCPVTIICPISGVIAAGGSCPPTIPTTGAQYCNGAYVSVSPCSAGVIVTYSAGWNLVGGPTGTILTGATGPIYMLTPGSSSYVQLPQGTPLQGGIGYWASFPSTTTITLPLTATASSTVPFPAGPFVLIGNPTDTTVSVGGFGAMVLVYDPTSGTYSQTNQLSPGRGAWAASPTGGQLILGF